MPDTRISDLTVLTAPAAGDLIPIVDISDTTMAASGTTKRVTQSDLSASILASAQPLDATLTALANLTIAADSLAIGTGADAFTQTTFAANTLPARASTGSLVAKPITDFGLSLIDDAAASNARTTLGLGTIATQAASSVAITGGTINGATVGATTPATGAFTSLSATGITTVAAGTAALPAIVSTTGTADTGLWFPAADTLAASTAGVERIRIGSTGNVGIGTTSPTTMLNVVAPSGSDGLLLSTYNSGYNRSFAKFTNQYDGATVINVTNPTGNEGAITLGAAAGGATITSSGGTAVSSTYRAVSGLWLGGSDSVFGVAGGRANTYLDLYSGSSIRMTINTAGNVGIGTSSPNENAILDVTSTTKAFMPPRMTTTQKNAIASPTSGMVVYDSTLNKLSLYGASAWQTVTSV